MTDHAKFSIILFIFLFDSRMSTLDPSLTRSQLLSVWRSVDPTNVGSVELSVLYDLLSSKYGKDKGTLHERIYIIVLFFIHFAYLYLYILF